MAPEVRWQASSAATSSGSDSLPPDRESVESLLRKLIKRIEESERRYAEALDELNVRLGQVSYSASVNEALGTPEETETLERLRRQLSDLGRLSAPDLCAFLQYDRRGSRRCGLGGRCETGGTRTDH